MKTNILATLFLVTAVSCEKIIDEKIEVKQPKLVINAFFNPDSLFAVSVTKSISILSNDTIIFISDASVKVYESDSLLEELSFNNNLNIYKSSDNKPLAGKNYKIEVDRTGFLKTTAEVSIPSIVQIVSVDTFTKSYYYDKYSDLTYFDKVFNIKINDPTKEENYYIIYIDRKTKFFNKSFAQSLSIKNPIIELVGSNLFTDYMRVHENDGLDFSNDQRIFGNHFAMSDNAFNGKSVSFEFELGASYSTIYDDTSSYVVKLLSINKDYFTYINSESLYRQSGDPFSEAVSLYSNIKNGYGIAFGSSTSSKVITWMK